MPSLASEIITHFRASSSITSLVGEGDNARVYPKNLKERCELPAITIRTFSGRSFESVNNGKSNLGQHRVEINCFGKDEDSAYQLMLAVDHVFRPTGGFRGQMGSTYVNSINAEGTAENGTDPPEAKGHGYRYWESRDYLVTHYEA